MGETIHKAEAQLKSYHFYDRVWDVALQSYKTTQSGDNTRSWVDTTDGVKNSYWRSQIKTMANASTGVTSGRQTIDLKPDFSDFAGWVTKAGVKDGHLSSDYRAENTYGLGLNNWTTSFGLPDPSQTSTLSAYNQAASQLAGFIDSVISGVNLGETVGEIRETVGTLRRPLESLRNLLTETITRYYKISRGIKGGRIPVSQIPKVLGDTYLEFRFGWNPLVSDVAKAYVTATADRMGLKLIPVNCRGRTRVQTQTESTQGIGITNWSIVQKVTSEQKVRFKGVIRVDPTSTYAKHGPTWGALPHQYPATVWNCLPWSFVADYFLNVGDMIQSWCSPHPNFVYLDQITEQASHRDYTVVPFLFSLEAFGGQNELTTAVPGYFNVKWFLVSRSPVSAWPYVQPELNIPDLGSRPWTNLAAMALSAGSRVTESLVFARQPPSQVKESSFIQPVPRSHYSDLFTDYPCFRVYHRGFHGADLYSQPGHRTPYRSRKGLDCYRHWRYTGGCGCFG